MELIPIRTPLIRAGDDVASILLSAADVRDGDIIVVSSKAIATAEGTAIDLRSLTVTDGAREWYIKTGRSAEFMQAVLDETQRLNGAITGHCQGALLTELRPDGLTVGSIFAPNAGMDQSNIDDGWAVGWPIDPVISAKRLREGLNRNCAVIIGDSCCRPRRLGVTAFALTVAGMDPLKSEIGSTDLFGHELRVTVEALADQLTTAANILMGNAAQSTPAVIIRDHGLPFSDFCGWVDGIEPEEDLFKSVISG
jgi:coenzyme F420-0:L-glutamate ligase / coenzyme F420-1:gamma-L-glutamate ligase